MSPKYQLTIHGAMQTPVKSRTANNLVQKMESVKDFEEFHIRGSPY